MKYILIVILFVFSLGCSHVSDFEDFSYKKINISTAWGNINASLIGTDNKIDNNHTVRSNPYELLVWFSVLEKENSPITLYEVRLLRRNGSYINIFSRKKGQEILFKPAYNGTYDADFSFKNLFLDYEDYDIFLVYKDFSLGKVERITIPFDKNYKRQSIGFWDRLMGI